MKRKGFTLIELIVGLGLVSVFALAAVSFLASQLKVNTTQSAISHAQTSMEATMNLIRWDIMMAGFGSPQSITPQSGGDASPTAPDPDGIDIHTYFSPVGGNGHWSYLTMDVRGQTAFPVRRWSNNVFSNLSVGDSVVLFNINKVKVGEGKVTAVQVMDTATLRITVSSRVDALKGTLIFSLPQDGATTIKYRIMNGNLYRNNVLLQQNVEDFQVAYWIDKNNDGIDTPAEWQGTFNQSDLPYLKLVRVTVVKLIGPDTKYNEQGKSYSVEDDSYMVPASRGHFRRRIYSITVKPRNMGV